MSNEEEIRDSLATAVDTMVEEFGRTVARMEDSDAALVHFMNSLLRTPDEHAKAAMFTFAIRRLWEYREAGAARGQDVGTGDPARDAAAEAARTEGRRR